MPRLLGYWWKVEGTFAGTGRTYICTLARTKREAERYAEKHGYRNAFASRWVENLARWTGKRGRLSRGEKI